MQNNRWRFVSLDGNVKKVSKVSIFAAPLLNAPEKPSVFDAQKKHLGTSMHMITGRKKNR